MESTSTEEFLRSIVTIEPSLLGMGFRRYTFDDEGPVYFVTFEKNQTRVEFLFGPPEWNVEMIIYTSKGKFAFEHLLSIPAVTRWVNENRYRQKNGKSICDEMRWFIELLRFALPLVE